MILLSKNDRMNESCRYWAERRQKYLRGLSELSKRQQLLLDRNDYRNALCVRKDYAKSKERKQSIESLIVAVEAQISLLRKSA